MSSSSPSPSPSSSAFGTVPSTADVVITGGGVMGASIAFHLAEAGVTDVVVVERDELCSGSSGKPIGGVRAQFSDPLNIELGDRSLRAFQDFPHRPGADIRLDSVGYLFLLTTEQQAIDFEASVGIQNSLGVPTRMIGPDEAHRLCPYISTDGLLAAAFSPTDGHARPALVVQGYADAAARAGVAFATHTSVTGIDTAGDRVTAVHTDRGRIACATVICTAGAWSGRIGAMAGVDLPVRPVRRQLAFTEPLTPPAPRIPFTIDFASSAYFHNSDDGLLFGLADPAQPDGFDTTWTPEWLELFRDVARDRAPALADMAIADGWAGLYEVTPDHNALIGRSGELPNFLYATGFSGHGFLQAPAVGEIVRDLHLGRAPFVDISPLSADRFRTGAEIRPEAHVV
ncbi:MULTISPECIES: FAD-binding oxidoreductase [unclassified Streptomyces]|uniref:NAD(P)/FAD-dependent oxidoreductase n=1 Tax=unclassified Streptomyces TaxID=2593676 RepID=UPI0023673DC9|nr:MULTISPECIES: FAD-binding oxidoreductase [unclassified Streptomyces]MDF3141892.1 FAD-binding oxidoreductase [Streptomyces sp. T21Q-yed]WDF39916.1 FAD-binding oxidoreductase [Streptomyces sp. T12]